MRYSSGRAGNKVTYSRSIPCIKPAIDSLPQLTRDGRNSHVFIRTRR
jgi:hypothetical protein